MAQAAPPAPAQLASPLSVCFAVSVSTLPWSTASETARRLLDLLALTEATHDDDHAKAAADERHRVLRFRNEADRARALLAKLLLAATTAAITGTPVPSLRFHRSSYGKPQLVEPAAWTRGQFAFNLSHHGDWVVLAVEARPAAIRSLAAAATAATAVDSSSAAIVPLLGLDVTSVSLPPSCATVDEYFDCMAACFTEREWQLIRSTRRDSVECEQAGHGSQLTTPATSACRACQLVRFAWFWSLKESLIKAIGTGLSFDLQHIEFHARDPIAADGPLRLFDPVGVTFLGMATFLDAATNASGASAVSLPRPAEISSVGDLTRDVDWRFESTLLADQRHVVSRCRGYRRSHSRNSDLDYSTLAVPPATPSVTTSAAAQLPSSSMFTLAHPDDLGGLGVAISCAGHGNDPSRLCVRQLTHDQITPPG